MNNIQDPDRNRLLHYENVRYFTIDFELLHVGLSRKSGVKTDMSYSNRIVSAKAKSDTWDSKRIRIESEILHVGLKMDPTRPSEANVGLKLVPNQSSESGIKNRIQVQL